MGNGKPQGYHFRSVQYKKFTIQRRGRWSLQKIEAKQQWNLPSHLNELKDGLFRKTNCLAFTLILKGSICLSVSAVGWLVGRFYNISNIFGLFHVNVSLRLWSPTIYDKKIYPCLNFTLILKGSICLFVSAVGWLVGRFYSISNIFGLFHVNVSLRLWSPNIYDIKTYPCLTFTLILKGSICLSVSADGWLVGRFYNISNIFGLFHVNVSLRLWSPTIYDKKIYPCLNFTLILKGSICLFVSAVGWLVGRFYSISNIFGLFHVNVSLRLWSPNIYDIKTYPCLTFTLILKGSICLSVSAVGWLVGWFYCISNIFGLFYVNVSFWFCSPIIYNIKTYPCLAFTLILKGSICLSVSAVGWLISWLVGFTVFQIFLDYFMSTSVYDNGLQFYTI